MNNQRIYILGGHQTDYSRNWARENLSLFDMFSHTMKHGLESTQLNPEDITVGHVGNFVADLFCGQAQLGGFFGHVDPKLAYLPASRHEAACASGSMAILSAMADLESGRYDLACVMGIEMMRNVSGTQAAENLRAAAWADKEWQDTPFVWPCAFDDLMTVYQQMFGLDTRHVRAISQKNFDNAKHNPNAQSRNWNFTESSFTNDEQANPTVCGAIHKQDCGQVSDGAAVVFLATEERAKKYAKERNLNFDNIPFIKGWGHINAPMLMAQKLTLSQDNGFVFPHINQLFSQTLKRAGLNSLNQIGGLEVHDCFNITEYMILDHTGINKPGEIWKSIEAGVFNKDGTLPVNASGGLMGLGHPVGATGIRMLLDCYKQVSHTAGDYQLDNANNMMTFNLGGSATTCASFIVGK